MKHVISLLLTIIVAVACVLGLQWARTNHPDVFFKYFPGDEVPKSKVVEIIKEKEAETVDNEAYSYDLALRAWNGIRSIAWDVNVPSGKKMLVQVFTFENGKMKPLPYLVLGDEHGERRVVGEFIWNEKRGILTSLYFIGESIIQNSEKVDTPFLELDVNPQAFIAGGSETLGGWNVVGYTYVGESSSKEFSRVIKEEVKGIVVLRRFINVNDTNTKRFGELVEKGITE